MKKIFFIITTLVFIVIIFLILSLLPELKGGSQKISPTPAINNQQDTIQISNTPIKNFYKDAAKIDKQGDVYIVNVPNKYQILYMERFNSFIISVTGSPFEDLRHESEQVLLEKTGMSQSQACSLNIQTTTPSFANPDFSGKPYPLSFCQQ